VGDDHPDAGVQIREAAPGADSSLPGKIGLVEN
jgi:hypothetical protein